MVFNWNHFFFFFPFLPFLTLGNGFAISPSPAPGYCLFAGYHSISSGIMIAFSSTLNEVGHPSRANLFLICRHSTASYCRYCSVPILANITRSGVVCMSGILWSSGSTSIGLPSSSTAGGSRPLMPLKMLTLAVFGLASCSVRL